jgi:uncharacterized protein YxjI
MPLSPKPGEQYVIRRKVLKLLGASFHVYGPSGSVVAYCKQKAFKLREDIRLYTDESMSTELMRLATRQIIDFGATYDVTTPEGGVVGSLRRKGLKSTFLRDEWLVFNPAGKQVAMIREKGSGVAAIARRFIDLASVLFPQSFDVTRTADGTALALYRQHFNPLVYRLSVSIVKDDPELDELVLLAAACLIAAIEGRQS